LSQPFVSYALAEQEINWSDELEQLHEECSRTHFIDVWTRRAMLARIGPLSASAELIDVGCSSGYMLEDLRYALANAHLTGVDLVAGGLRRAHQHVPDATLLQADACDLPLDDECMDAAVSANLLEHVPDDTQALREILRILRPGARAVIVVPFGPGTYDYYDRFLGHERRYGKGELARKAHAVGFEVLEDIRLGAPLYPAFWIVKQRNRLFYGHLRDDALTVKVKKDIARTTDSAVGSLACRLEDRLLERGVRLPFGIRSLTVLRRPPDRT
jgi:SAM-dependent methyltransferase